MFALPLAKLAQLGDLVDQAMKVFELDDGSVDIVLYEIPEPD